MVRFLQRDAKRKIHYIDDNGHTPQHKRAATPDEMRKYDIPYSCRVGKDGKTCKTHGPNHPVNKL